MRYLLGAARASCSAEEAEMEARGHVSRERQAGPAESPGESSGGEEGSKLVRGCKEQGQAQHTHSPAQGRRDIKGLSLNAAPGQGLETSVRLSRTIKACWCT